MFFLFLISQFMFGRSKNAQILKDQLETKKLFFFQIFQVSGVNSPNFNSLIFRKRGVLDFFKNFAVFLFTMTLCMHILHKETFICDT